MLPRYEGTPEIKFSKNFYLSTFSTNNKHFCSENFNPFLSFSLCIFMSYVPSCCWWMIVLVTFFFSSSFFFFFLGKTRKRKSENCVGGLEKLFTNPFFLMLCVLFVRVLRFFTTKFFHPLFFHLTPHLPRFSFHFLFLLCFLKY